jgi:hypothetical protein
MKNIRALSLITLFCFLANHATFAVPGGGLTVVPQTESPAFLQIEIPENLASVEEIFQAPAKSDPRLILYIQTAHGSYEAQLKIKQLLDYLYQTYGFKLIFVEGAVEQLNPDHLRLFPDAENNRRFADHLARQGELTGAEFYLMDGPSDVEAVGIEMADIYRENYEAFKAVYRAKPQGDAFLDDLERRMQTLASRLFSADTRRMLSEWKKFESGHRDFLPYVRQLAEESRKVLGVNLESLFSQVEWPQVTRLLVLQSMEKDLDRVKAEREKTALLDFLKKQGVSETLTEEIEELGEKKISMNRLADAGQAAEEARPRYLMERLIEEAGPQGFQFHDYPAFSLYAGYLILQSELESRKLFEEIELLFKKILDELTHSEIAKNLLELYRDQDLLRKLFALELTRAEWGRVYYRREWIEPKALRRRLTAVREEMENDLRFRAGRRDRGLRPLREEDQLPQETLTMLDGIFESAFRFYDVARRRETVFHDIMRREMEERNADKAVLVAGGFHTEGVVDLLRRDNINYGVLMPKITQMIDNVSYITNMMGTRRTMFDYSNLEAVVKLQELAMQGEQKGGADATAKSVTDILAAYFDVGKFQSPEELKAAISHLNQVPFARDLNLNFSIPENENRVVIEVGNEVFARIPINAEGAAILSHALDVNLNVLRGAVENLSRETAETGLGPRFADTFAEPKGATVPAMDVPPAILIPADRREQFGGVTVGPKLGNTIQNTRTLQAPQFAVAALTGGIVLPSESDLIEVLMRIANEAGSALPSDYHQIQEELAKLSPAFADPNAAGVLGVEIGKDWRLPEAESFADALAAILVLQPNQAISVLVNQDARSEVLAELPRLEARIKELPDVAGQRIGDRFGIIVLRPTIARQQIERAFQRPAAAIRRRTGADVTTLLGNAVLMVQRESGLRVLRGKRVESLSLPGDLLRVVESVVGMLFSTIDQHEELDPETLRTLEQMGDREYRIIQQALEQMGIAADVAALLAAAFRIASSA